MSAFLVMLCLGMIGLLLASWGAIRQQDFISANRTLWPDPWCRVLLAGTDCGLLCFWLWVVWQEQSVLKGIVWFVLIMGLGNLGTAGYLLWHLRRWRSGQGGAGLLLGRRGE